MTAPNPAPRLNPDAVAMNPAPRPASRPRLARQLGPHHFAFYRGALEGLDLAALGARYLETGNDLRRAKATQRWIRDELIAAARLQKPHVARLLTIPLSWRTPNEEARDDDTSATASDGTAPSARMPAARTPSLEEFRVSRDPDGFYGERELLALFQAEYPVAPGAARRAQRQERLRKKLNEAIRWLESFVPRDPGAADPLMVWLDPTLAERLEAAGLITIADLLTLIARRGKHWHRKVARLGPVGAARIGHWLRAHRFLGAGELVVPSAATPSGMGPTPPTGISLSTGTLPSARTSPSARTGTDMVPFDRLRVPSDLCGATGTNRAYGNKLAAADDLAAIAVWLRSLGPRPHTVRSYRTQAERFLLWMLLEREKPLSSATTEDCISYRDWLNALGHPEQMWFWRMPATDWIGPRAAPRFSTDWRPFTGPLAPTSQKLAVTILTALAEWLTRQQYLSTNPWDGVPPSHNLDGRMRTDHALTPAQWKVTLTACEPIEEAETRLRLRFTLLAAYALGLRLAELASMQMARRTETAGELNLGLKPGSDGEGWDLEVLGKRQKRRRIPVPSAVMAALADYLQVSGKGNDPEGWPAGEPLIATLPGRGGTRSALSTSGLYRMLKRHFAMAAREMETARDAGHLLAASTHWLRHTHATHSLAAGVPIEAVQENMGHSSVAITAIYSHAGRKRRKAAVDTLIAFAGEA